MIDPIDPSRCSYYRPALALVHHLGFGFHADACAPGILALLDPVRERNGLVVELGCGSGLLTRHLIDRGHRVVATDASPAMLDIAREYAVGAEEIRTVVLPDDPLPAADAVVSVGHVLSYLADEAAIDRALIAAAQALRPGGVLAIDLCDLKWGDARPNPTTQTWVSDDWVLVTKASLPTPERYVREMTLFLPAEGGLWRRDEERHDNVLIDTSRIPALLADLGVEASVAVSFGSERLPHGLVAVVGRRPS